MITILQVIMYYMHDPLSDYLLEPSHIFILTIHWDFVLEFFYFAYWDFLWRIFYCDFIFFSYCGICIGPIINTIF